MSSITAAKCQIQGSEYKGCPVIDGGNDSEAWTPSCGL